MALHWWYNRVMSAQQLSPRSIRRIERATGLKLRMAWSHGGYTMGFATEDHRHGWYDKKSGEWGFEEPTVHYSSCFRFWPETV